MNDECYQKEITRCWGGDFREDKGVSMFFRQEGSKQKTVF